MQLPKIIVVIGEKGAGKTTFCELMAGQYGYQIIGFADPLYVALCCEYGVTESFLRKGDKYSARPELMGMSVYAAMTMISDCLKKRHGENYLIDKYLKKIITKKRVITKDAHFNEELAVIEQAGGRIIKIEPFQKSTKTENALYRNITKRHSVDVQIFNIKGDPGFMVTQLESVVGLEK